MTKAEIVKQIAEKTGIEKETVSAIVENFMEQVRSSMIHGENIYLRGFGTFQLKRRAEKVARNISKNTTIVIPAHTVPAFKPSPDFMKLVADNNH
jgi:DNA-binding protein HU-beta